jgi:hypothetical protein
VISGDDGPFSVAGQEANLEKSILTIAPTRGLETRTFTIHDECIVAASVTVHTFWPLKWEIIGPSVEPVGEQLGHQVSLTDIHGREFPNGDYQFLNRSGYVALPNSSILQFPFDPHNLARDTFVLPDMTRIHRWCRSPGDLMILLDLRISQYIVSPSVFRLLVSMALGLVSRCTFRSRQALVPLQRYRLIQT